MGPPHFWSWQIMRPTVHAPHTSANFGVELHPIGGVHPILWHALCGARPGFPAVFAAKKSNVRGGNELAIMVERIEMVAIGSCNIEAGGGPRVVAGFSRIDRVPGRAAVRR